MVLEDFLSTADAERARRTLRMLNGSWSDSLVLTGGFAVELHMLRCGHAAETRALNDIDFLAESFERIPKIPSAHMLFRHVHPHDPPGKTLIQSVSTETAVRLDVFRANGNTMMRAVTEQVDGIRLRMISLPDLTVRCLRLCMDLASQTPIPAKHARDLLRLLSLVDVEQMEPVWQEHRKPSHPHSFTVASALVRELIPVRKDLQIIPVYSKDVHQICLRCSATESFPLADPSQVLALLGYC